MIELPQGLTHCRVEAFGSGEFIPIRVPAWPDSIQARQVGIVSTYECVAAIEWDRRGRPLHAVVFGHGAVPVAPAQIIEFLQTRPDDSSIESPILILLSQYLGTSSNRAKKWSEPKYPDSQDTMFLGSIFALAIKSNRWICCGVRSHLDTETEKFLPIVISTGNRRWKASQQQLYIPPESNSNLALHGIAYGAGRWVAVGSHSTILQSNNGKDWTVLIGFFVEGNQDIQGHQTFQDIVFANNIFILPGGEIGDDEEEAIALDPKFRGIAKSGDGLTWESSLTRTPGDSWIRAAWGNGRWVVMGRRATEIPGDPFNPTPPPPGPFNPYPGIEYRMRFNLNGQFDSYEFFRWHRREGNGWVCGTTERPDSSSTEGATQWVDVDIGDTFEYIPSGWERNVNGGRETHVRFSLRMRDAEGRFKSIGGASVIIVYSYTHWISNSWDETHRFSGCPLGSFTEETRITNLSAEYDFLGAPPPPPPPGPPPFPPVSADSKIEYTAISASSEGAEIWTEHP